MSSVQVSQCVIPGNLKGCFETQKQADRDQTIVLFRPPTGAKLRGVIGTVTKLMEIQ
jgi:hypothetical protein